MKDNLYKHKYQSFYPWWYFKQLACISFVSQKPEQILISDIVLPLTRATRRCDGAFKRHCIVWLMAWQKMVIGVRHHYQGAGTHMLMPVLFLHQPLLILLALLSPYLSLWPAPFLLTYIYSTYRPSFSHLPSPIRLLFKILIWNSSLFL